MRLLVFFLILLFVPVESFSEKNDLYVVVLAYHSFIGNREYKTDVSLEDLRGQMLFFKSRGFAFVSFSDITEKKLIQKKNILITVDDGNRSVYSAFYKVFKPLGIKPLLGIYPGVIGKSKALSWKMLQRLVDDGCEIASHGYYHRYVNERLLKNNPESFVREVYLSKTELEKRLGVKVRVFVYPYGVYSDVTVNEVIKAGYAAAFGLRWGVLRYPRDFLKQRYDLPRYMLMDNWGIIRRAVMKKLP